MSSLPVATNIPISKIDGIAWPALVGGEQSMYLSLQFQLERSQWWSEDELVSAQLQQLHLLLQHAFETVPYYKKKYGDLPFDFSARLTLNEWRRLPILTRDDLQKAGKSLHSKAVPKSHGNLFTQRSSGSTGKPVVIKQTRLCSVYWRSFTLRESLWHRPDMRGKLAVIRHHSDSSTRTLKGISSDSWGPPYAGLYNTGPAVSMHSAHDIPVLAEWLSREQPAYLLTYPSILKELCRYFMKHGLAMSGLKQARSFGEALDMETRQLCRQVWGVTVVDGYSSQEVGIMALQCPQHEHYHVQSESVFMEVLDPDGNPCRPGEVGNVVVTPLHNFATPMLRYAVGDFAEAGEACDCGRGLPVIARVLGRTRNLVTLPDGSKHRPSVGIRDFEEIAAVSQAQLVQRSLEHVELRLVTDQDLGPDQEAGLTKLVQQQLGYPFRITFTMMDEIPRGPTDKYEDFLSEL